MEGVENLPQAGGTGSGVRHRSRMYVPGAAGTDPERSLRRVFAQRSADHLVNAREGGVFVAQAGQKSIPLRCRPPDPDQHPFSIVAHIARQPAVAGNAPNRRTEPNALNQSAHPDFLAQGCDPVRGGIHDRLSQSSTRLLPESAMITLLPAAEIP